MNAQTEVRGLKRLTRMMKDGWQNLITGLGTGADKQTQLKTTPNGILSDEMLEDIFVDDGLGTNIIKAIPDDMFREGWEYEFPEVEDTKAEKFKDEYDSVFENIDALSKIRLAFYWARLYGGSLIMIGALDNKSVDQPLDPKKIKNIEYLRVIDRSDVEFSRITFQLDPTLPRYGLPEFYPVKFNNAAGTEDVRNVHYTRIIEIHGDPIPAGASRYTSEYRYWGLSVLQNVFEKLKSVGSAMGSVSHLLDEFSVGKYKLGDLVEILSQEDGMELMKKRVQVMDMTRSVFRSMYFDKDDDFIRENVSFAGVPEVMHIFFMLVSSCTQIPITRLFGVSPAGMNATGESDMRNYYDKVRSKQTTEAAPILLRLVRIISEWKNIPEPYVIFNPLQQLSPREQAEVEKLHADKESVEASTFQAFINAGVLEPYEVRFLKFGNTLDDIPVPEEEDPLPPVETLPEENEGEDDEQNETDDEAKQGEADEDEPKAGDAEKDEEDNEDNPDTEESELSDDEIKERIEELEAQEELSEEEQEELDELKKKLEKEE